MTEDASNVMRARCNDIGTVISILFGGCCLLAAVHLCFGVWFLFQPDAAVSLELVDTGRGFIGYCGWQYGEEFTFAAGVLSERAAAAPELTYGVGYFFQLLLYVLVGFVFWYLRIIFHQIFWAGTPFTRDGARAIHRIGILIMVIAEVRSAALPLVCAALGLGECASGGLVHLKGLLIGGIVVALSYIFEYGVALQQDTDDTI